VSFLSEKYTHAFAPKGGPILEVGLTMHDSKRRHHLGGTFNRVASTYREARPGYPNELFRLLVDHCGLGAGSRVLEIGAGAGQATVPMLKLGAQVTALEPGRDLIRELLEQVSALNLQRSLRTANTSFEEASVDEAAFDLVVSATAFHWVDPEVRFAKSAYALRDSGWLAVWSNRYGDPDRSDPFHEAIQPLLKQYAPELLPAGSSGTAQKSYLEDLTGAGSTEFEGVREFLIRWEGRHNPQQVRALFSTFSGWIALPARRRERLLNAVEVLARDRFGGLVIRPYRTIMHLWHRKARKE
jgi:SAM-dependent methyltransferase